MKRVTMGTAVRRHSYLLLVVVIVLGLGFWEYLVRGGRLDERSWSKPTEVFTTLITDLHQADGTKGDVNRSMTLTRHMSLTVMRWAVGFGVATALGLLLGVIMGMSRTVYAVLYHVVNVLRGLPSAAIWPVVCLIVGYNLDSQFAVIVFGAIWPVIISTSDAVRHVPLELLQSLRFMRVSKTRWWMAILAAAAPATLAGVEVACGIAYLLAITTEVFYPSLGGIGWYLNEHAQTGQRARVFGGVILAALLGWLLNSLFRVARRKLHPGERPSDIADARLLGRRILKDVADQSKRTLLEDDHVTQALLKMSDGNLNFEVLYQGDPYLTPRHLAGICSSDDVIVQRDVLLESQPASAPRVTVFARSWIIPARVPVAMRDLIHGRQLTLGQMVESLNLPVTYRNHGFLRQMSASLGPRFGVKGTVPLIMRERSMSLEGRPFVLIHEYVRP